MDLKEVAKTVAAKAWQKREPTYTLAKAVVLDQERYRTQAFAGVRVWTMRLNRAMKACHECGSVVRVSVGNEYEDHEWMGVKRRMLVWRVMVDHDISDEGFKVWGCAQRLNELLYLVAYHGGKITRMSGSAWGPVEVVA